MTNPIVTRLLRCHACCVIITVLLLFAPVLGFSQDKNKSTAPETLKKLTLEQLMDIEVTSVSKRPQHLAEVASAIQVISRKDIIQSGAKTLAEALRLAPNLQVAQVNSSQWAISARGFDNVLANKLLVLIDGRTVYTPLYAGVFWDVQNLILEDVDRIEVISGPGGTLWGANAVNGVINIITKSSRETKGLYAEAATGISLPGLGSVRYGGQLAKNLTYRVYGTGFRMGHAVDSNGVEVNDDWSMLQGGLRLDWEASDKDVVSLQQNIYNDRPNPDATEKSLIARGTNVVTNWNHIISDRSNFQLQAYYDHTFRDFRNNFTEDLKTFDIEWQQNYQHGRGNQLTYGLNFRMMDHKVTNLQLFQFLPERKKLYLYSLFLQEELSLVPDRLHLTLGSKIEHNSYTGFEFQPNGRLRWTPAKSQTLWMSVSRAVRTPARIDRDFFLLLTPELPFIGGSESFKSETVIAYELGWRFRPREDLSLSVSTFYNSYDNIRSAEPGPEPFFIPITFANGVKGKTYGFELAANYQITRSWNLRGGYTFLKKDLEVKSESKDINAGSAESNDPQNQFVIQSSVEVLKWLELGTLIRYVDRLSKPAVPSYTGLDLRVAFKMGKSFELNIVGQNLLDKQHFEFVPSSPAPRQIERSIYGKLICRL